MAVGQFSLGGGIELYPVGSIYMSMNATDPSVLFGGTWERIKDRFVLAAGDSYASGATGGEATHTLTVDEMPSHKHGENMPAQGYEGWGEVTTSDYNVAIKYNGDGNYFGPGTKLHLATTGSCGTYTGSVGGGAAHNNMPPYLVAYMWYRVA